MFLRRLKAFGHFAIDYLDLLIAAGLAVLFSYMGARNTLHDDGLTQATIALLGVLSLVIFRERWERKKIVDKVDSAMASVGSAKPWHVLEDVTTWDIKRPELATTTSVKDLRFLHNEVVSIYEFQAITTGAVTMPTYRGGAVGGPQVDLPLAERFTAGGRTYLLISLRRVWRRGERMRYTAHRELKDCFVARQEFVAKEIRVETDQLTMRVTWPKDKRPITVHLDRAGRSEPMVIKTRDGRPCVAHKIIDPQLDERIAITWEWDV